MCVYDLGVLKPEEVVLLKASMAHYKNYDKLDILIEMSLPDPYDVLTRKKIKKVIKYEGNANPLPEAEKFCNTDHCEIDYSKMPQNNC
jgi:hypothetical protein